MILLPIIFALLLSLSPHSSGNCARLISDGVTVEGEFYRSDEEPEHQGGMIIVSRNGHEVRYDRTGRSAISYPWRFFKRIRGKDILEAGVGSGTVVYQMNQRYTKSSPRKFVGLDIALSDSQKKETFFVESDMAKMPFDPESYDIILSNWSIFSYGMSETAELRRQVMNEFKRVLRKGGRIRLGAVYPYEETLNIISEIPGLKISYSKSWGPHRNIIEVVKVY